VLGEKKYIDIRLDMYVKNKISVILQNFISQFWVL